MGRNTRMAIRTFLSGIALLLVLLSAAPLCARSKKEADAKITIIDSGTFDIMVSGRKVGTESFTIKQLPDVNVAASEIRIDEAGNKAQQTSEFRLTSAGELRRYEWHEIAPGKGEIVLEPQDEFLVEHITPGDKERDKKIDQSFLMSASTLVLDDFFFSQREILAWRYLASTCKVEEGQNRCLKQKSQFGIIIPRQHVSSMVSVEYVSHETIALHGQPVESNHFRLSSEDAADWELWLDNSQKLVRILIPMMNTEVVRE